MQSTILALSLSAAFAAAAAVSFSNHAAGAFEVMRSPLSEDKAGDATISRMSLDKRYHGDLEATGKGVMLSTGSSATSGAYVALEVVTGKLKGHEGSFVLQHAGIAAAGSPQQLNIVVVPNSGTGELRTLSGKMVVNVANGMHSYEFEYSLSSAP